VKPGSESFAPEPHLKRGASAQQAARATATTLTQATERRPCVPLPTPRRTRRRGPGSCGRRQERTDLRLRGRRRRSARWPGRLRALRCLRASRATADPAGRSTGPSRVGRRRSAGRWHAVRHPRETQLPSERPDRRGSRGRLCPTAARTPHHRGVDRHEAGSYRLVRTSPDSCSANDNNLSIGPAGASGSAALVSELARVLVRFDHVARLIVNANHCAFLSRLISSEKLPGVSVVMIFVCPRETAATL